MSAYPELPDRIERKLARARRLEWWSIFFLATIIGVMYLALGSSQAMQAAWVEDMLGLIPPLLFVVSTQVERRQPTRFFPYGFHRAGSLAYLVAASTLIALGGFLAYDAVRTVVTVEHPTIGSFRLWGREVWLGWAMVAALAYSAVPPVILGRMKKRIAPDLADKVLYTDADMMAADWRTAVAGIAGIIGIWLGYWWADAAAAGLISLSILGDGVKNGRIAVAELLDGAPRRLQGGGLSPTGERIRRGLEARNPGCEIRIRQTGRYIRAVIVPDGIWPAGRMARELAGDDAWQLIEVSRHVDEDGPEGVGATGATGANGVAGEAR